MCSLAKSYPLAIDSTNAKPEESCEAGSHALDERNSNQTEGKEKSQLNLFPPSSNMKSDKQCVESFGTLPHRSHSSNMYHGSQKV